MKYWAASHRLGTIHPWCCMVQGICKADRVLKNSLLMHPHQRSKLQLHRPRKLELRNSLENDVSNRVELSMLYTTHWSLLHGCHHAEFSVIAEEFSIRTSFLSYKNDHNLSCLLVFANWDSSQRVFNVFLLSITHFFSKWNLLLYLEEK